MIDMLYSNLIINDTYQVVEEIGSGGMGVVYLCYHLRLQKYVVLKKLKNSYDDISALRNEVDILKSLHHQNLPQVYDFIRYEGDIYTVIDYINGYDLNYYINNGYSFSESQLIKWLRQLCEVLVYIHSRTPAVLHTDIKPGNIIITAEGDICLIDFGISLRAAGKIKGMSKNYSSPEQYALFEYYSYGQGYYCELDGRTDIYSLAATFYHLMTGVKPDVTCAMPPIRDYSLPYSDGFLAVIDRAMQYDINKRFASAEDMLKAIDNIKKQDSRYKKYVLVQLVSWIVAVALVVSGVLLTVNGFNSGVKTRFEQEYSEFVSESNHGETSQAEAAGRKLLNNSDYSSLIDSTQKAEILHKIGDCYYEDSDFTNAAQYYEQALSISQSELYYRDHALALIRDGRFSEAQEAVDRLNSAFPGSSAAAVLNAQLCYENGDYNGAVGIVDLNAGSLSEDPENLYSAYIIKGDACVALGVSAVEAYESALGVKETANALRRLASAHMTLAVKNGSKSDYSAAELCYNKLREKYGLHLNDTLNYSQAVLALGEISKYEDCKKLLLESAEIKPDCRAYILLAQLSDLTSDPNALTYCEKACELYGGLSEDEKYLISHESLASIKKLYQKYSGREWVGG